MICFLMNSFNFESNGSIQPDLINVNTSPDLLEELIQYKLETLLNIASSETEINEYKNVHNLLLNVKVLKDFLQKIVISLGSALLLYICYY